LQGPLRSIDPIAPPHAALTHDRPPIAITHALTNAPLNQSENASLAMRLGSERGRVAELEGLLATMRARCVLWGGVLRAACCAGGEVCRLCHLHRWPLEGLSATQPSSPLPSEPRGLKLPKPHSTQLTPILPHSNPPHPLELKPNATREFRVDSDGQRTGGALESARERNRLLESQVAALQQHMLALQQSRDAQDHELSRLRQEALALAAAVSGGGGGGGRSGGSSGFEGGGLQQQQQQRTPNASIASAAGG